MMRYFYPVILLLLLFAGCRQNKQAGSTAANPIVLDTLHVTAKAEHGKQAYRGSNSLPNDLLHTKLHVTPDWQNARLNGKAELLLRPYYYPVNRLTLNARGMEVKSVEVYGPADAADAAGSSTTATMHKIGTAGFKYDGDSLRIELGLTIQKGQTYSVVIDYVAKPDELGKTGGSAAITDDKGLYFINPRGENPFRMPQIWTQGETQSSSVWFPTIDSPNERMTQEILITVDAKYTTLSNGILMNSSKNGDGTRTDHWKLEKSHAPYLAMMVIGEFVKVTDEPWQGKEVSYYVEKEFADDARAIFAETREMLTFYSSVLGVEYPWEKYAQVVVREYVSGAMENTSATLHGDFMVYQTEREVNEGRKGTAVIAHELFHQWFGDMVTCESWSNLPLNESFATYGEYLWEEHRYGRDAADERSWQSRQGYIHSRQEADLIRFHYRDKEDMFDAISYNKGGQVIHMLRNVVGDDAFFASLKKYLESNAFKPVEIHHLRLAFEETTGRDMNWFFNQWFLAKGRPKLNVKKSYDAGSGKVQLIVEQKQNLDQVPLYYLPLAVDVYMEGSTQRFNITVDDRIDTFSLPAKFEPQLVNFDANRSLLADVDYQRNEKELSFQYLRAPLFADRMEALQLLEPRLQDSSIFLVFRSAALTDRSPYIRKYAVSRLEKASPSYAGPLKDLLVRSFQADSNAGVRAAALATLNRRFLNDPLIAAMNDSALGDRHLAVNAEALSSLAKRDAARAVRAAQRYNKERGRDVIIAVTNLYGLHGDDGHIAFFRHTIPYVTGFDMLPFCASYSKLAQRCRIPGSVLMIASDLENLGKGASKYTRYGVAKGLKDLVAFYEQKESMLKQKAQAGKKGQVPAETEKELREASDVLVKLQAIYDRVRS